MLGRSHHHPHFFNNKEIDALYFTEGLICFGAGLVSVFVPIYFWQMEMPIWRIIFFYLLNSASFVVFAYLFLPLLRRLSDKMMMSLGVPFLFAYFLALGQMGDIPWLFYVAPALAAIYGVLFNVGYHLDFTCAADGSCLGREVGGRFLATALVRFSSPVLGGLLIGWLGFSNVFLLSAAIMIVALLPLFAFPRRTVAKKLSWGEVFSSISDRRILPYNLSGVGYSVEVRTAEILWPLLVFFTVGSIKQFGGLVSLGLLASAIATYFIGYLSDKGERRHALSLSASLHILFWLGRAFLRTVGAVVGLQIGSDIAGAALNVAWGSQYYKLARAASNPCAFILGREVIYSLSRIIYFPVLMLLSLFLSLETFLSVSFILAAAFSVLYFAANRTHTSFLTAVTKKI